VLVLLSDDGLLAVLKPSGLLVHRGLGADRDTVLGRLAHQGLRSLHPVHRLDRGTSGVLVLGRSVAAARELGRAWASGRCHKRYLALVRGQPPAVARVDHPVPKDEGGARVSAVTRIETLATVTISDSPLREQRYSLVRASTESGRFHQVRRHLKHLGHPLVGDANYGRSEHNRLCAERFGLRRLALHALDVVLPHPLDSEPTHIVGPVPDDLGLPLARMGFALDAVGPG
jgi:tRNA pseudouridine65 synthase